MYIYPDNLKSKATLWLWTLRDLAIIGIGSLISVFALSQLGFFVPIVLTDVYKRQDADFCYRRACGRLCRKSER